MSFTDDFDPRANYIVKLGYMSGYQLVSEFETLTIRVAVAKLGSDDWAKATDMQRLVKTELEKRAA